MIDPFKYKKPTEEMLPYFEAVADAISKAFYVIAESVPACADRTLALRRLQEARMWANAAISFEGRDEIRDALD
jgi:hypothetical protein